MLVPLYPRQEKALTECRMSLLQGDFRPMVQGATGFGKTVLGAHIAWRSVEKGGNCTFTVPAIALINQTVRMFERLGIPSEKIGVVQADHERTNPNAPIQICSVQTLYTRNLVPETKVWLVDEAHKWFDWYAKAFQAPIWEKKPIIGLSATPWTKGLGKFYGRLIRPGTIRELIDEGLLADYDYFAPYSPDLSGIEIKGQTLDENGQKTGGEFNSDQASKRMSEKKIIANIVDTWKQRWGKPWTFCFAVDCAHAQLLQQQFLQAGVRCGYMDAHTPNEEREEILNLYRNQEIDILMNVGVLILGVDEPCDCIILAMPTWSEMKYVQICGRGVRPGESQRIIDGKKRLLILDHGDNWKRLNAFDSIGYETLHDGEKQPRKAPQTPLDKPCSQCGYIKPPKMRVCPQCGHVAVVMSHVKHVNGELVQVNGKSPGKPARSLDERESFYQDLVLLSAQRNWKQFAIRNQFRDRYSVWPDPAYRKLPKVTEICPDTKQWLRAKAAAFYAKKDREEQLRFGVEAPPR